MALVAVLAAAGPAPPVQPANSHPTRTTTPGTADSDNPWTDEEPGTGATAYPLLWPTLVAGPTSPACHGQPRRAPRRTRFLNRRRSSPRRRALPADPEEDQRSVPILNCLSWLTALPTEPCWATKALVPSIPHKPRIGAWPPSCWVIHEVTS